MVALCLTKAHIDSVGATRKQADDKNQNDVEMLGTLNVGLVTSHPQKEERQKSSQNAKTTKRKHNEKVLNKKNSKARMDKGNVIMSNRVAESKHHPHLFQGHKTEASINRSFDIRKKRDVMLQSLDAMRGGSNDVIRRDVISRQYRQRLPDARKDIYRVHKWRIKSGRSLDLNYSTVKDTIKSKLNVTENLQRVKVLPPLIKKQAEQPGNIRASFGGFSSLPTVMEERERQFKRNIGLKLNIGAKETSMLGRLRHQMKQHSFYPQTHISQDSDSYEDRMSVSSFESRGQLGSTYRKLPPVNATRKLSDFSQSSRLPPIQVINQHQANIKQVDIRNHVTKRTLKQSDNQTNSILQDQEQKTEDQKAQNETVKKETSIPYKKDDRKLSFKEDTKTYYKRHESMTSPGEKKTSSSMTMVSLGTVHSSNKEGDTPTDSDISGGVSKLRRQKKGRLVKMDTRSSPQFFRTVKPARMEKLMSIWRSSAKLIIWFSRLWHDHRITVDDSYNIRHDSAGNADHVAGATKHEVLFDVTDYKMKNQLRLSETTRRILTIPTNKRTEKDISLVQTALRNIKAISDYSTSVQRQIGKHGHFAGFEGKRVVVREGKSPLNYYILLAGSAVVIKEDESGNTNPVLFMRRGDVFGEHELLEGIKWRWSIVTLGYCEFLFLDKDAYRNIFITGGGGGLLTDPDRGGFLRSISLLKRWPTELLNANPNRCLFRYFKRGALLVNDNVSSEWIYVVKSGSCSVLKTLMVEKISQLTALRRLKLEQAFVPEFTASPHLVEKIKPENSNAHLQLLTDKEELEKEKAQNATIYQQLEMSSVLKELNTDVVGNPVSSRADIDENDRRSEMPLSSSRTEAHYAPSILPDMPSHPYQARDLDDGFRMSRNSDRHPPRTPSPMKAAYLRTGIGPEGRGTKRLRDETATVEIVVTEYSDEGDSDFAKHAHDVTKNDDVTKSDDVGVTNGKHVEIGDTIFGVNTPSNNQTPDIHASKLHPVHVSVRQLTRGGTFGLGPALYADQPSLALVSNGAECLMLNKKFYLENATDDCLKYLREKEYPYPSDNELLEQHWRLVSWQAYQATVANELYERYADA